MASWANVLKAAAPTTQPTEDTPPSAQQKNTAVIDANAIINGIHIDSSQTNVVTISEVLEEIRDKQSRQFLATLPYSIEIKEPTEESLMAVLKFAKETGDIHALSSADMKLLALAHTLEVATYGSAHMREHPVQPKVRTRSRKSARQLPGWGRVANPAEWKVVDEAEEEGTNLLAVDSVTTGTVSHIVSRLQPLDLSEDAHTSTNTMAESSSTLNPPEGVSNSDDLKHDPESQQLGMDVEAVVDKSNMGTDGNSNRQEGAGMEEAEEEEDDEDAWEVAGKSRNAERRHKRKQIRKAARTQVAVQESERGQRNVSPLGDVTFKTTVSKDVCAEEGVAFFSGMAHLDSVRVTDRVSNSAAVMEGGVVGEIAASVGRKHNEGVEENGGNNVAEEAEDEEYSDDDSDSDDEEEEDEDDLEDDDGSLGVAGESEVASAAGGSGLTLEEEIHINTTSSVMSITADFPMQNVLLQMGLRLVTRDGCQISRLSRWALRCHACFHVTKEMGIAKMFCPKCGNMTMERVEINVGADGAEFLGVRRKHCLKGTRFSLPKPKGGRGASSNPILSEDMMVLRMGKKLRRKAKTEEKDPFAPEMGSDSWFKSQQTVNGGKGTQYMMTNWKNNPNERKNARNNRRG
ncbi:hypothetical protein CEUSTIGMA_g9765.t1 [Chlamydomonas eustigma]|uniref:PIN domain-containing protein n=1 Tax=Chlamydomonas eustigma TaxID=1157962 RepID=A0A250XH41_9CHLO|nr:hypothetical protein CEUSTIGMA_g9765.t1 [Chlamydomonas eustigma]|eukprot:GAX82336.1 hypothetical protein CEUSTIGMA_g9765.t1 [Chlamydomonas eustigma]